MLAHSLLLLVKHLLATNWVSILTQIWRASLEEFGIPRTIESGLGGFIIAFVIYEYVSEN